ncbi:MAG: sugar:proton symporter [Actinomycetota bacterium]
MAEPAHEHVEPAQPHVTEPVAARKGWSVAGLGVRMLLTLVGAAGLIVGAFLDWIEGAAGVDLDIRAFWQTTFDTDTSTFVETVGFVMIVLGLLAIVGMAPRSGWLTRFAGALGIAGFVLFLIEVYRADQTVADVQAGAWVALVGGVVALIGGFFGTRAAVTPAGTTVVES